MSLPSLKTSLLTVSESKLVTFQAAGVNSVAQNANVNAAPPPQQNKIKKTTTQFLSFSREDRSSVFLLRATTITSVSTYGTSENRRFVNLTETITTMTTKSYTDQNQAYTHVVLGRCVLYVRMYVDISTRLPSGHGLNICVCISRSSLFRYKMISPIELNLSS